MSFIATHRKNVLGNIRINTNEIQPGDILEFGVSEKAMSTELFLKYSNFNNCKLFSVDSANFSSKFKDKNWEFIHSRDDDYEKILKIVPKNFYR